MTVPLTTLFGAPHRYYQGPGAFDLLGQVAAPFGQNPLIVADAFVLQMLGDRLAAVCSASGLTPILRPFEGEITYSAIAALTASLDGALPGIAVGIGGGKSLDAAKAVALKLRLPVVTIPTIASNDSPTSAAIAMYDERHTMIAVDRLHRSPEAVLVDTALIAKAPLRFLLAGIGDAISKKFEADGCRDGTGITPFGTRPTLIAIAIADACYTTLRRHAVAGVSAAAKGEVTPDLEAVIEATLLMSGLGFENGGLSLAHSLTRGLVKVRGTRDAIHGDQIAWALLVQLAAEGRPDAFIRELLQFYREIGLPTNLAQLGLANASSAEVDEIARWTMTAPHLANMALPMDTALIVEAIWRAEILSGRTDV